LAEQLVVGGKFALALEETDRDRSLVVLGGRKDLAAPCRARPIPAPAPVTNTTLPCKIGIFPAACADGEFGGAQSQRLPEDRR
jgi:hypothetical protein